MSREEKHVAHSLAALCKTLDVKCAVQIGAEDGYEVDLIRQATGCRAVAIEADTDRKPMSDKIEWHHAMIGATDCMMDFYRYAPGLSSQLPRGESGKETPIRLDQKRLDTFCTVNGIVPDVLVIDTEGTTLDVLEGTGRLLDDVKLVYAEVQSVVIRPGVRTLPEVDALLTAHGFTQHRGLPSYDAGAQGNLTWVRKQ